MSTRSSARRLLSPIEDPEKFISRRNQSEPSLLFDLEEDDMSGQAPPQGPIPDLHSMEELLQAPTDGVGDVIVVPLILANQFELKIGLLNLVTAIAFHGFENDDPHSHIRRFTKITQTVKLNNVPADVVKLLLFLFSLKGAARTWLEKEPPNSITTWNDLVSKFVNRFFPPSKTTNLRNEITRFQQRFGETFAEAWDRFKDLLNKCPHHGFSPLHQIDTFYNSLNQSKQDSLNSAANASASGSATHDAHITSLTKQVEALLSLHQPVNSVQKGCETCGGPHAYYGCQAAGGYTQEEVYATTAITTRSGVTLAGPSLPLPPLSSSKEVEPEPKTTTDQVLTESTKRVLPLVVQPSPASTSSEIPSTPVSSHVVLEPNPHQPPIPYPSSFVEALAHMPKFAKMVKDLLSNKEKLLELANTPLNKNCSAVLLKKLPEKLRDTGRFLIPCDFYGLKSCMALANLGASINLMPLYVWKKLSLPELTPTRMTLELATRTVAYLAGIAEDVFVQVGKFTFPAEFVVVDYDVDPRVPLILGRPFLRTAHALVDVHEEELTLRVGDEKLVFNVESTSKYPRKHGDESIHKIYILDITCEDHFHEVLNVQKLINPMSGSPNPSFDPVVEPLSPSLTPLGDSDFLLEETDAFLSLDNSIPPGIDNGIYDSYFQIPIDPQDQEKTTLTYPYGTFAYRRMPFGLCNAPGTFQRCMVAIFYDMIEKTMEVFMYDFLGFGDSFSSCLSHFDMMLKRGIEVDRAKVDVIAKLPPPTTVKGIRSFLGHTGFYKRFIQDFSKIARLITHLLEIDTPFFFLDECLASFKILKKKLTEAPILMSPDWELPFELMCDASDFAVGAILGQRKDKYFRTIHYASKTLSDAQTHYTTAEKELLAVVYAFEKFRSYLVLSKTIV
ncbi:reverse transcriptase domain-containing protein [Tanacetum coccineum]